MRVNRAKRPEAKPKPIGVRKYQAASDNRVPTGKKAAKTLTRKLTKTSHLLPIYFPQTSHKLPIDFPFFAAFFPLSPNISMPEGMAGGKATTVPCKPETVNRAGATGEERVHEKTSR